MKNIRYGFFGEDKPQQAFLESYLERINEAQKRQVRFQAHEPYNRQFKGVDRRGVFKGVNTAAEQGFGQPRFRLDCLFVGADLDTDAPAAYEQVRQTLLTKITPSLHASTVFMLPMQCIEHWALYLKRATHEAEPLEALPNRAVQQELYGKGQIASSFRQEVVRTLTKNLRINWLANRSPTFKLFHRQVEEYLKNFRTPA